MSAFLLPGVPLGFFVCVDLKMGCAHVAQLVERILGKDEVSSSNLLMGSIFGLKRRLTEIDSGGKQNG